MMREGQQKDLWMHTSALLALIANANSDGKRAPAKPEDFYPFPKEEDQRASIPKAGIGALKVMVDGKLPREVVEHGVGI